MKRPPPAAAAAADDERRPLDPEILERIAHAELRLFRGERLRRLRALVLDEQRAATRAVVRGLRILKPALLAVDVSHFCNPVPGFSLAWAHLQSVRRPSTSGSPSAGRRRAGRARCGLRSSAAARRARRAGCRSCRGAGGDGRRSPALPPSACRSAASGRRRRALRGREVVPRAAFRRGSDALKQPGLKRVKLYLRLLDRRGELEQFAEAGAGVVGG